MIARSTTEQVADLRAALARAGGMIACGAAVDLRGLDDEIARLMEAARQAPPADHLALRAGLEALLDEVDSLGIALKRCHDADTAMRATDAYAVKVATR